MRYVELSYVDAVKVHRRMKVVAAKLESFLKSQAETPSDLDDDAAATMEDHAQELKAKTLELKRKLGAMTMFRKKTQ